MPATVAQALRVAYDDPPRRYHTFGHATDVARRVTELGGNRACLLAAWAHDVVYRGQAGADEGASAAWLEARLPHDPDVTEAARLVRLTASHDPGEGDRQGAILCDADLAVLGVDPATYEAYRQAVREEYAHVPDPAWREGRAAVLGRLLARDPLFTTPEARQRWEAPARRNLQAELATLTDRS